MFTKNIFNGFNRAMKDKFTLDIILTWYVAEDTVNVFHRQLPTSVNSHTQYSTPAHWAQVHINYIKFSNKE